MLLVLLQLGRARCTLREAHRLAACVAACNAASGIRCARGHRCCIFSPANVDSMQAPAASPASDNKPYSFPSFHCSTWAPSRYACRAATRR